jgi:tRNA A58 N-methylase Trm61
VTPVNFLQWVAVASIPVMVMLSSTSYVSGFVAAMPFIWIVPLALYLISFIVSFRGGERSIGPFTLVSVVLVSLAALSLTQVSNVVTVPILLLVLWGAVFAISHYCHEWLYEHRPQAAVLPWFYVALSLGGVFGSALILASTLFILKSAQEFVFVVIATILVALYQLYKLEPAKLLIRRAHLHYLSAVSLLLIVLFTFVYVSKASSTLALERNFFGTKRVIEATSDGNRVRALLHELTAHGFEYMDNEEFNRQPVAYYTETSGLGRVMIKQKQEKGEEKMEVAVIGLGAGLLSAFCRPQDHYTFFEIDPEVVAIANKYFTYLERCENKEIKLGDARQLMLEESKAGVKKYDFIIMDAYADDAAPAHLMTAEAVGLYLSLLNPGGVVAIHVSSRYLDLLPVVSGLAETHNLAGRYYHDLEPPDYGTASIWTMLAREENVFAGSELEVLSNLADIKPVYWTDTKNALLPIVRYVR